MTTNPTHQKKECCGACPIYQCFCPCRICEYQSMTPKTTLRERFEKNQQSAFTDLAIILKSYKPEKDHEKAIGKHKEELLAFVESELASQKALLVEGIEKLKKHPALKDAKYIDPQEDAINFGYGSALDDVLALIREQH